MLFNSWEFIILFAFVLGVYFCLDVKKQNLFLVVVSYFFYGWWDWRFCGLLLLSTIVDFWCSHLMVRHSVKKKRYLYISIFTNLGILSFFKYFNFFTDSFSEMLSVFGFQVNAGSLSIILPVGISFYTFQTLAYSIDCYRGKMEPEKSFLRFALYVSFFPQLVAGPIERAQNLLPQFVKKRVLTWENVKFGGFLCLVGFFKKMVIADNLSPMVDEAFFISTGDGLAEKPWSYTYSRVFFFALQIYCDFSGYSNIARGVSKILGVDLMRNFFIPYSSSNITDFWRKWHISLSSWLRDYLYIPLGGSRFGELKTYRNLMTTMLLGGLWHGASWNFVAWGGLHGIYLAVHKMLVGIRRKKLVQYPENWREYLMLGIRIVATYHLVLVTWVFFRSRDFSASMNIITHWLSFSHGILGGLKIQFIYEICIYTSMLLLIDGPAWKMDMNENAVLESKRGWKYIWYFLILLLFLLFAGENEQQAFIYFQF